MIELKLNAEKRTEVGKGVNRRLRAQRKIPGVIYGKDKKENILISVDYKEFYRVSHSDSGEHAIINVQIDDKVEKCVIKEIQRDPVTYEVLHIDFQAIDLTKEVHITLPIELINVDIAKGVKEGGIVEQTIKEVVISCLPNNIPDHIKVDIANVGVGEHLTIGDLQLKNVKVLHHAPSDVILSIVLPRSVVAAQAEEK